MTKQSFLNTLNINPYTDSKAHFSTLNTSDKELFLDVIFDIFAQNSNNLVFSKFLKSHPQFENYVINKNLDGFNLGMLKDDTNVLYACMRATQDIMPNVLYHTIFGGKNVSCILAREPFSPSYRNNMKDRLKGAKMLFFVADNDFLLQVKDMLDMQKNALDNKLNEDLLESLLLLAKKFMASDIHFTLECDELSVKSSCLFRINGNLVHFLDLHSDLFLKLSKKLKLLCKININDAEIPQDGHFNEMELSSIDSKNDIRISFLPTINGESIALRIPLDNKKFITLENLNIHSDILLNLKKNLLAKSGLLIISGPTNSAKTTLLYSSLRFLNNGKRKILTIEDPIEQVISGISQCQINKETDLTFASALKYLLRQDGDVIMIGEIRDTETLRLALSAALSGHLVIASLHASSAKSSISRMIELDGKRELLDSVLKCVISQRLIKTLCPFCKKQDGSEYVASGCHRCYYQGFGERELIQEIIDFRDDKPYYSKSLQEKANELYAQGIIPFDETLL